MKAYEFIEWLNGRHPEEMAEDWDNVGLLVGDDEREITHVFLTLDLTEDTLEQALSAGADMILSHHPMIFSGMKKINNHTFTGRKVLRLIESRIPYYAMHTNYDICGMADRNAAYLGLKDTRPLTVTDAQTGQGLGRIGSLPKEMTLRACGEHVKKSCKIDEVRIYGDPDRTIRTMAVCSGSGKSLIPDALRAGVDVYVTGDIDHHSGIDAVAQGLCVIDAGHYGTEYIFMKDMKEEIAEAFPGLTVTCEKIQKPYLLL